VDVRLAVLHAHVIRMLLHEWLLLLLHTEARNCCTRVCQATRGSASATLAIKLPLEAALALVKGLDHALD